jgi:hypothetical protein
MLRGGSTSRLNVLTTPSRGQSSAWTRRQTACEENVKLAGRITWLGVVRGVRAAIEALLAGSPGDRARAEAQGSSWTTVEETDRVALKEEQWLAITNAEGGGGFMMGLLTGTVLGAGIGMLFAPKRGSEMRHKISDSAGNIRPCGIAAVQEG